MKTIIAPQLRRVVTLCLQRLVTPYLRDYGVACLTAVLVVGLVIADLLASLHWNAAAKTHGDVQNYVLFTTVQKGDVSVTTGTQFDSTSGRRIVTQWCYLTREAADGVVNPQVTIATASASGRVTRAAVPPATLSVFGFDPAESENFVATHCRFQKGE